MLGCFIKVDKSVRFRSQYTVKLFGCFLCDILIFHHTRAMNDAVKAAIFRLNCFDQVCRSLSVCYVSLLVFRFCSE